MSRAPGGSSEPLSMPRDVESPDQILSIVDHRPWALPSEPWVWRQSWSHLLFAHWRVPAEAIRQAIPEPLVVQEFDGSAWIGVVPFMMENVARRPVPPFPLVSSFPEINVRSYVELNGTPGVWFFSLDATNPLAVLVARRFFDLPYNWASVDARANQDRVAYRSRRRSDGGTFAASYGPEEPRFTAMPGTIEHWLTERYCLYARSRRGSIRRADVHHRPWPLQSASVSIEENSLHPALASAPSDPDHVLFSRGVDVLMWNPVDVAIA